MCMNDKDLKDTRDIWHELLGRGDSTKIQRAWLMQEGVIATKHTEHRYEALWLFTVSIHEAGLCGDINLQSPYWPSAQKK